MKRKVRITCSGCNDSFETTEDFLDYCIVMNSKPEFRKYLKFKDLICSNCLTPVNVEIMENENEN
jgi:hypothetical protein